jgi:hypothetical protein
MQTLEKTELDILNLLARLHGAQVTAEARHGEAVIHNASDETVVAHYAVEGYGPTRRHRLIYRRVVLGPGRTMVDRVQDLHVVRAWMRYTN